MSKKILRIVALTAAIFSFSADAYYLKPGRSLEAGVGGTIKDANNDNITFYFGEITENDGDVTTTVPVVSHIKEFEQYDSFSLFTALNYNFCNGMALGAELSYTAHKQHEKDYHIERAKLNSQSVTLLAKGKYYIDFGGSISPFIGAGIGFSRVKFDFNDRVNHFSDLKRTKFAYLGTAGLAFDANEDIKLALAYSIRGTADIENDEDCNRGDNDNNKNQHGELTGFSDFKNNVQNIEVSVEFKL